MQCEHGRYKRLVKISNNSIPTEMRQYLATEMSIYSALYGWSSGVFNEDAQHIWRFHDLVKGSHNLIKKIY